ncbi:MAG TPA: carbohydrate binding domain-containing protein [Candidatus Sulfotelmatobacter sp.]|nr:carbohydrate binding domain-containing protein [Candidatus Sulfotelmatobacter sp.]
MNSPARRRLVATIAVSLAVVYVGLAASRFAASWLGGRVELTSLKRAAWLDPGNADYRNHLGRFYDLVNRDPATAVGPYREAVALNPHSARLWFDLSGAYQVLGDTANQTAALESAIHADSMTPDVAWEAANLYLVQGENEKAMREFRVVLANDPSLADAAIQFCWRVEPDVDVLLRDVVPPRNDAYVAFLTLLETKEETARTAKVWSALMQTHQPFERRQADQYFRYLIQHKDVDQAVLVWQQTAARFGLTSYLPSPGNLIVNGSFSLNVLNAGFDWQHQGQSGVKLELDPTDSHAGRQSLTITFDGPGINDAGIYQFVAVQPNTAYQFSAYYKNVEMEGAGGPHFTIQDMYTQAIYYESDELTNAGFWKSAEGDFTTGPDCKLVVLHVRRLPAGSPIRGKLWIDDFHLTRKPS